MCIITKRPERTPPKPKLRIYLVVFALYFSYYFYSAITLTIHHEIHIRMFYCRLDRFLHILETR